MGRGEKGGKAMAWRISMDDYVGGSGRGKGKGEGEGARKGKAEKGRI